MSQKKELVIGCMCEGATCRSPQAFGVVRHQLKMRGIPAIVRSFGIMPELRIPVDQRAVHLRAAQPHSIAIMAERGIDITDHVPAHVLDVGISNYDLVLVAAPKAHTALTVMHGYPAWKAILLNAPDGIYNPFDSTVKNLLEQDLERYRATARQLDDIVPRVIEEYIIPLARRHGLTS